MYKLKTSSRTSLDLSIGFDRVRGKEQEALTRNRMLKEKIMSQLCSGKFLVLQNAKKKQLMDGDIN